MLSKCANPTCSNPFHYLRDGRLFRIDVDGDQMLPHGPFLVNGQKPAGKVEHFWLCASCATTLTLAVEKGRGVVIVPREPLRRAS